MSTPAPVATQSAVSVTSTPAVDSSAAAATTSAPAAAQTVTVPASTVGATPGKVYGRRKVVRDGVEYYCKREKTTGSRLQSKESCLTMAQLEQQREASRDFLEDNNRLPGGDPNINGGQMSAMPMSTNR